MVVEWALNVKKVLPKSAVWVRMEHGRHDNERAITVNF